MAKLAALFVVVLCALAVAEAAKKKKNPNKVFPPNGHVRPSDKEINSHPKHKGTQKSVRGGAAIPTTFDARVQWPKCDSIKSIRDQGQCGTCWAVSSASVLSDRACIASKQTFNLPLSANQAAGCSIPSQSGDQNCQGGGDPSNVYKYASLLGIATGGEYKSNVGCVPYTVGNNAPAITCAKSCTNSKYTTPMANDLKIVDTYWINYQKSGTTMTQAQINTVVNQMQTEIMTNGPITASFTVYDDFQTWDAEAGLCYKGPGAGAQNLGGHAIKIIGWNVDKAGTPYWIISNSWGTDAGDNGLYWLALGINAVGIESSISAPVVNMLNTCDGASFCDTPVNSGVVTNAKNSTSPTYLFQGDCTQQVTVSASGKLSAVGPAVPISKVFLGAPPGPIVGSLWQNNQLWLINNQGQAGSNCIQGAGSTKFTCGGGSISGGNGGASANFYTGSTLNTWSYYPSNANWLFNTQGQGKNIGTLITSKLTAVNSLLNIDGLKTVVFGKDTTGKAAAGIMSYPTASATAAWVTAPGPVANILTCSKTA